METVDGWLTDCGAVWGMDQPIEIADEIKKAELHETVKQALIRLPDDPQIQQKIIALLRTQRRL